MLKYVCKVLIYKFFPFFISHKKKSYKNGNEILIILIIIYAYIVELISNNHILFINFLHISQYINI